GRGQTIFHTFVRPGKYPVTLKVCDDSVTESACNTDALIVTINEPPVADAGGDINTCGGQLIVFNGSRSFDPEGGVLGYSWDFDDGGPSVQGMVSPTHTYLKNGVYTVTLTVTDDSELSCNTSVDQVVVTVHESPVASAGEDIDICAHTPIQFDGSKSTDSDGVVNSYYWDFGDDTFTGGAQPIHTYRNAGVYVVTLTVTGDEVPGNCKNTDSDQVTVTVLSTPIAEAGQEQIV
ncbi:MAG: PKD domain-containing protein, partial [Planctomycetes bacterium]|nr:PKD domain-containing protein [Planctomycetota bacterium]